MIRREKFPQKSSGAKKIPQIVFLHKIYSIGEAIHMKVASRILLTFTLNVSFV